MEQQKVKPQAYENLLTSLKSDYRQLMILHNAPWSTPESREEGRLTLEKSMKEANRTVRELQETPDPELRYWHDQLVIQTVLAEGAVQNPNTLKR